MQVGVEAIYATIQHATRLLEEAQALGQQYIAHSENIIGAGWNGDACTTSHATAIQVHGDLTQAVAAHHDLHAHLKTATAHYLAQQHDSKTELASVHPGGTVHSGAAQSV